MDEMPKLAKDANLLSPKKTRIASPLAKALLLGSSVLAGFGILHGTTTSATTPAEPPSITRSITPAVAQIGDPAPLVLKPATALVMAQHGSHSSHSSHSSHRSHSSHHSSSF